jgi:two-component system chemotaxis family response regulator WspR
MEPGAGPVVLLVDDQPIIAESIRRMLATEADTTFHYCQDPARALAMATEVGATVILQDLVMPDLDGFVLVRFFRKNPATAAIPIIVLSSKESPVDKSRAFAEGAIDYLVKLPDKIELCARIRAHSRSFLAQKQRDDAYRALEALRKKLEESNAELQRLTHIDGLTGVANRRRYDEFLDAEWRRARRNGALLSVVLIDIDHFKKFNDHYGHQGGDDCLRQVAAALHGTIRRGGDLLARYGGEEFAAVLPEVPHWGACRVAHLLQQAVLAKNLVHEASATAKQVTISLGVATLSPKDAADDRSTQLVALADAALYRAKEQGRNRFVSHPDSVGPPTSEAATGPEIAPGASS